MELIFDWALVSKQYQTTLDLVVWGIVALTVGCMYMVVYFDKKIQQEREQRWKEL